MNADYESFEETKDEWIDDEEGEIDEEEPEVKKLTEEVIKKIKEEISLLKQMHKLAKSILKNSKGEVLLTALQKGFEEAQKKGASALGIRLFEKGGVVTNIQNPASQHTKKY